LSAELDHKMRIIHDLFQSSLPPIVAAILCGAAALPAATAPHMPLETLVERSPRIVHGSVGRSWTAWDAERRFIWTHYEVHVSEALRGPSTRLVLSEPGGTVDGMTMHVPGAPRYGVGEEVVVFAYPTGIGLWRTRGLGQGKYSVSRRTGLPLVRAQGSGALPLVERGAARLRSVAAPAPASLDSLLDRVRGLLAEEAR
jgi:hypothetical protein